MFLKARQEYLENVVNEIQDSNLYEYPRIDFILIKEINGKCYYAAGISDKIDPTKAYLYRPKARTRSIPIQNIRYDKQKYRELFEECIEGYVLQQINKGYKIIFMSIAFHISLWEFIDTYYENLDCFIGGMISYFTFCYETGISSTLLSHYSCVLFPDYIHGVLGKITLESFKELAKILMQGNRHMINALELRNELYNEMLDEVTEDEKTS